MNRISDLTNLIKHNQDLYYKGIPEITDEEFDGLWDELRDLDPENLLFKSIGSDSSDGFNKAEHVIPMGSQQKAKNEKEFIKWSDNHQDSNGWLTQYKLDGCSLELQYSNGKFIKAVTRGNGIIGDDITVNVRKMNGFKDSVSDNITGGIRGEVILRRSVQKSKYSDKANCRNAANGIMKRLDGTGSEDLNIIVYDITNLNPNPVFASEMDKINWLTSNGFDVVNTTILHNKEEVIKYRADLDRDSLDYDIDGIVIKSYLVDQKDLAKSRPDKQIAFKFELDEVVTTLEGVDWSISGNKYTPVGIMAPVNLCGTTVKQANLCNIKMIRDMGLFIGSRVVVTKRGEIIPKIERLVSTPDNAKSIDIPTICECCGSILISTDTLVYCPNTSCSKVLKHKIWRWVCQAEIMDVGGKLIDKLVDDGLVKSIIDFYTITESQIASIDRMGVRSAKKIIKNRDSIKEIDLSKFIVGFDIDGIGTTTIDTIIDSGYDTLDKIFNMTKDQMLSISGIGPSTADTLYQGLLDNRSDMISISTGYITIKSKEKPKVIQGKLTGKAFTITGKLSMKRSDFEALIINNGGTITNINKDSYALITDDPYSGSSKNAAADKFGIKKISEEELMRMIK